MRSWLPLAAAVALLAPAGASARAPSADHALARAVAAPGVARSQTAAMAVDLRTGRVVFAQHPDLPLVPASNEKLAVAYTALRELGPSFRFRTRVLGQGRRTGKVWRGNVILQGGGDPTLTSARIRTLAKRVARRGIRRITGRIVADASWFDRRWSVRGWKPSYVGFESPPLSALVVDRGWRHDRPVRNPPLAAAAALWRALVAQGIQVRSSPILGRAGAKAVPLATVRSHRLSVLLPMLNAHSDNFVAEMLLKQIGRSVAGKGTTAAGAAVVRRDLRRAGVPLRGVRIVDGSGLSRADRVTVRALTKLLTVVWQDRRLRPLVRGSLAVSGVRGTLARRLSSPPTLGFVRAKTGTTDRASALSGYVGSRFAFAVVQNGRPVAASSARAAQDRFVSSLTRLARRG